MDNARRKLALKQGGELQRCQTDLDRISQPETSKEVVAIDEATKTLARDNPHVAH